MGTETSSGFDLFRRAICEQDQTAWATIVEQYRGLLLATIHRQPMAAQLGEDDAYWVNRALQRFWCAIGPERLAQFPGLPAIVRYLQLCATSVVMDELRARRRWRCVALESAEEEEVSAITADHADQVVDRLDAAALWATVQDALPDRTDRLVARLSFVGALSPGEIFARHPERFATVNEVYRRKRNLLERLRRDPRLQRSATCVAASR
jgi:hypothetical protein